MPAIFMPSMSCGESLPGCCRLPLAAFLFRWNEGRPRRHQSSSFEFYPEAALPRGLAGR
jgi:hypothetical protein